jgi:hypothetical protein
MVATIVMPGTPIMPPMVARLASIVVAMAAAIVTPFATVPAAVTVWIGEGRRDGPQSNHRGNGPSQKSIHAHEHLGVMDSDLILPMATE